MPNSTPEAPKRMTLSAIIEMLLSRSTGERSSVVLARTASGETTIDVRVRTGDDGDTLTVEDAERKAREVYDRLALAYPRSDTHDDAEVTLTRNAKGETQVSVSAKTSPELPTVARLAADVKSTYDHVRSAYPMLDGRTAKPGSVA